MFRNLSIYLSISSYSYLSIYIYIYIWSEIERKIEFNWNWKKNWKRAKRVRTLSIYLSIWSVHIYLSIYLSIWSVHIYLSIYLSIWSVHIYLSMATRLDLKSSTSEFEFHWVPHFMRLFATSKQKSKLSKLLSIYLSSFCYDNWNLWNFSRKCRISSDKKEKMYLVKQFWSIANSSLIKNCKC